MLDFYIITPLCDGGWSYIHDQSRKEIQSTEGIKTKYEVVNADRTNQKEFDDKLKNIINNLIINDGCNLIFATSSDFRNAIIETANNYKKILFMECSSNKDDNDLTENMGSYSARMYEASYLAGVVAGKMTKSKIGYIASYSIPETIRNINAFTLGVCKHNIEAEVYVKYTSTWYDMGIERYVAESLVNDGADIIAINHCSVAIPQLVEKIRTIEKKDIWVIGYNSDMSHYAPESFLTAPVCNWSKIYKEITQQCYTGTLNCKQKIYGGLKEQFVSLSPYNKHISSEIIDLVEKEQEQIKTGELNVFSNFIREDGKLIRRLADSEIRHMKYYVKGVIAPKHTAHTNDVRGNE